MVLSSVLMHCQAVSFHSLLLALFHDNVQVNIKLTVTTGFMEVITKPSTNNASNKGNDDYEEYWKKNQKKKCHENATKYLEESRKQRI